MNRDILLTCCPWLLLLVVLTAAAVLVALLAGGRPRLRRLRRLHAEQSGAVQTLSFVLTLPMFIMLILLIVQVSQVMIGAIVVHYAAYATARAAIVWIPARVGLEHENCISFHNEDLTATDRVPPAAYEPCPGGLVYRIVPGTPKFERIASAAKLACAAISPSRNLGFSLSGDSAGAASALQQTYFSLAPGSTIQPQRLANKLAYAWAQSVMSSWNGNAWTPESTSTEHTSVELRFYHPNWEPRHGDLRDVRSLYDEVGWQDPIMVKVTHWMALLPGPARLLFGGKLYALWGKADPLPRMKQIQTSAGATCVYRLEAKCTLGNEGQKSVNAYVYEVN